LISKGFGFPGVLLILESIYKTSSSIVDLEVKIGDMPINSRTDSSKLIFFYKKNTIYKNKPKLKKFHPQWDFSKQKETTSFYIITVFFTGGNVQRKKMKYGIVESTL
jgi:hypothetical protein